MHEGHVAVDLSFNFSLLPKIAHKAASSLHVAIDLSFNFSLLPKIAHKAASSLHAHAVQVYLAVHIIIYCYTHSTPVY